MRWDHVLNDGFVTGNGNCFQDEREDELVEYALSHGGKEGSYRCGDGMSTDDMHNHQDARCPVFHFVTRLEYSPRVLWLDVHNTGNFCSPRRSSWNRSDTGNTTLVVCEDAQSFDTRITPSAHFKCLRLCCQKVVGKSNIMFE